MLVRGRVFAQIWKFHRFCSSFKMPSAMILLVEGAEEIETVIPADILRRGGVDVTIAGVRGPDVVICSRKVKIVPDCSLEDAVKKDYDAVICPGGGGAKILAANADVGAVLKKQEERGGIVAAICAGPLALKGHGIGKGKTVTSHPLVMEQMKEGDYTYSEERVVVDGKIITSRGPGTAFEFAIALVEALQGKKKAEDIQPEMLLKK